MEFEKIHNLVAGERISAGLMGFGGGLLLATILTFRSCDPTFAMTMMLIAGIILLIITPLLLMYFHKKFLNYFGRELPTYPGQIPPQKK